MEIGFDAAAAGGGDSDQLTAHHLPPSRRSSRELKSRKPQRLSVECNSRGTSGFGAKRADQRIGKDAVPLFERDHRCEHLLLALNDEYIGLQHALDRSGDIHVRELVK